MVEDAAEALGSIYGDKPCGSLGLVWLMTLTVTRSLPQAVAARF